MSQPPHDTGAPATDWLAGGGEMRARIRQFDWSQTPLGPIPGWPQSLRTAVSLCLASNFPINIVWGPDHTQIYNDAYRGCCGDAHPRALGESYRVTWASAWPAIGESFERAWAGEMMYLENQRMFLNRLGGGLEETFFTFSHSPIADETSGIGGLFHPVTETTGTMLAERRARALRDLSASLSSAEDEVEVARRTVDVLAHYQYDMPFLLYYRLEAETESYRLAAQFGVRAGLDLTPPVIAADATSPWPFGEAVSTGKTVGMALPALASDDACGPYPEPPHQAFVVPIVVPTAGQPPAVIVAGASPRLPMNETYRGFFPLVSVTVSNALAVVRAREDERRRAEALAEIDRAKTVFFSNVSHEFRTPLTLMLGPLEDVLRDAPELTDGVRAHLEAAHRNSLRLLKLVNTLLDFSRIQAGRIQATYEPTDLATATAELASVFRSAIEKAGLALVVDCPALAEPVYVDREMWEKIVLNLLSNALKFTFEGSIEVRLRPRGEFVELQVRDTGVGIPASELPKVFERFHRVRHGRARTHEGTGIGLALVQDLARLHGGEASVESVERAGSVFTVTVKTGAAHLPAERIGAGRTLASTSLGATPFIEEAKRWLPSEPTGGLGAREVSAADLARASVTTSSSDGADRPRIVWADDNADMREYVARLLGTTYDVEAVADGAAALAAAERQVPDLVLSDAMMPGLDGFQLLHALRANAPTAEVPVILLSARAGEESRVEGMDAGADDYLVKPFSARELLARVEAHLKLGRLRREVARARKRSEARYHRLFTIIDEGFALCQVIQDDDGRVVDYRMLEANPATERLLGRPAGAATGRTIRELLPDVSAEWIAASGEAGLNRSAARFEHRVAATGRWLELRLAPAGRVASRQFTCISSDITERKQAEDALRASEERLRQADQKKDEFLATLAHELRNPLAPVRTGLELIRLAGDIPGSVERVREMMERQIGHMVRLVDDLMDMSRITAGKIRLQRQPTPLAGLVNSAVEANRSAMEANGVMLTIDLPGEVCVLDVDATRFVQVLSNLLNNATKFTPRGGSVRVSGQVATASDSAGLSELTLSVSDSGIGIEPELLPRVFDLFAQGETSASQAGLGIGLALARRLVEMHGGAIDVRSAGPGLGSEFTIRMPVSRQAAAMHAAEKTSAGPVSGSTIAPSPR